MKISECRKYLAQILIVLFILSGIRTEPVHAYSRQRSSTLQNYLHVSGNHNSEQSLLATEVIEMVRGKDLAAPALRDAKKLPVDVFNFELSVEEPGIFNGILKELKETAKIINFQLYRHNGKDIFSLRLQAKHEWVFDVLREHFNSPEIQSRLNLRLMGRDEKVSQKDGTDHYIYRYETRAYFYLSLTIPYNTENLILLTDAIARNGLSIVSFLFPDYEDEETPTAFHMELAIDKIMLKDKLSKGSDTIKHFRSSMSTFIETLCKDIHSSCGDEIIGEVVVALNKTIAEYLIKELLKELVGELGKYEKDFVDAFKLVAEKIPVLRKDQRTPYVVHLLKAVKILVNEYGIKDKRAIIALLLHDAIEDNVLKFSELRAQVKDPVVLLALAFITRHYKGDKRFGREIEYYANMSNAQDLIQALITCSRDIKDLKPGLKLPAFYMLVERKMGTQARRLIDTMFEDADEYEMIAWINTFADLDATPEDIHAFINLAKLADRTTNLRSLDIGDDTFHRKGIYETFNTFIPFYINQRGMRIGQFPEQYQPHYAMARDTLFAELILRSLRFGFMGKDGSLLRRHYDLYMKEQKEYFSDSWGQDESMPSVLSYEFYEHILRGFNVDNRFMNAIYGVQKMYSLLHDSRYRKLYDYFARTPTKAPFFPNRIKSSTVVFIYRLYDYYKNLPEVFSESNYRQFAGKEFVLMGDELLTSLAELSKKEVVRNYLIDEIASKFLTFYNNNEAQYSSQSDMVFTRWVMDNIYSVIRWHMKKLRLWEGQLVLNIFQEVFKECSKDFTGRQFEEV
ncbi:MAG: hypothetical protein JW938_04645, partial [Candidatus Omnitrophica bacterium]|nr:hypothetical protein [Candidatus Omnitrophota bacterium]